MKVGEKVADYADVMNLIDWNEALAMGFFNEMDGSGCWLDGDKAHLSNDVFDNVFGPVPPEARYVAWFNK